MVQEVISVVAGTVPSRNPWSRTAQDANKSLRNDDESWWERQQLLLASIACWTLLAFAVAADHLTNFPQFAILLLYGGSYFTGGALSLRRALPELFHGHINVDLLMVVAAAGAATVDAWAEGAVLLGLFSLSNALQYEALGRTRRAVRALMDLSPQTATVIRPGLPSGEETVAVDTLTLDDLILVRPGERIPVDGKVVSGATACDQAAITGESLPVTKKVGDSVFAGTISTTGAIQVKATKLSSESTLSKIIAFVEQARADKSRTQRFTDAFEGKYAVGVIVGSALVAILPWLFVGTDFGSSFYRAMTLLVVASPCALVISTPAATLSGLTNAARHGILFKGGGHLEDMGSISIVAFDKTGTLTEGHPQLTDIIATDPEWDEETLLSVAASAERLSEHHLSEAIVTASEARQLPLSYPENFKALPGKGVQAVVGGRHVTIGNDILFLELNIPLGGARTIAEELRSSGKSAVYVSSDGHVVGVLAVADVVRPRAAQMVRDLRKLGVAQIVMMTGDNSEVAAAIANDVGIDRFMAELLPEAKLVAVRQLMEEGSVAMVGDGVNDAPALSIADLGVAMGEGTDVALETADVVLMAGDLSKLPYAISLSRRTRRTIIQNLTFSLAVIAVLAVLALTVGIPLPVGVFGHEGSTVLVVLNGLRLLRTPSK